MIYISDYKSTSTFIFPCKYIESNTNSVVFPACAYLTVIADDDIILKSSRANLSDHIPAAHKFRTVAS